MEVGVTRTSFSGLMAENRLDPRFEPLAGGVHVRLIFSNGIDLSRSEEDDENDDVEQQLTPSEKHVSASCMPLELLVLSELVLLEEALSFAMLLLLFKVDDPVDALTVDDLAGESMPDRKKLRDLA